MKIKLCTSIIIFLLFSSTCFAQSDIVKTISAVADSSLTSYLQVIPSGQESFYGFNSREEFVLAKVGKPYQIFTFSKEFFTDSNVSNKNYLIATNEFRVAVTVNGENRILLTVGNMNGKWQVVGIGAAFFAKELAGYEKIYATPNDEGMILRVYQLKSDFYITTSDMKAIPLGSAKLAFGMNNSTDTPSYSLQQVTSLIKDKLGNNKY